MAASTRTKGVEAWGHAWGMLTQELEAASEEENFGRARPLPGFDVGWRKWVETHASHIVTAPFAPYMIEMWEWGESLVPGIRPPALPECVFRGGGKSSTIELVVSYLSGKATRSFFIYVCDTQEAADNHVGAIGNMMERVGIERLVNKYGMARGWNATRLRTANGFNVLAYGLDSAVRGIKLDNLRPDGAILDDIDRQNDSVDATIKKMTTITHTVLPSGSNDLAAAMVQNLIHANSCMSKVMDGTADIFRDRIQTKPIPAVSGVEHLEVHDWIKEEEGKDGKPRYRIVKGYATWEGKPIAASENEINTFGLLPFLSECQHDVSAGGLMFPSFAPFRGDQEWHIVTPFRVPTWWDVWGSHDYGESENEACAFYVYVADENGDICVIAEHWKGGQVSSQQCQSVLELLQTEGMAEPEDKDRPGGRWNTRLTSIEFDYANTFPPENEHERRGEYPVEVWQRRGLPCVRAVKDRIAGWRRLNEWVAAVRYVKGKPQPRFKIFRGACPHLVEFLSKAPRDPRNPSELDKGFRNDHAGDSCRYGIVKRVYESPPDPNKLTTRDKLDIMANEVGADGVDVKWW